VAPRSHCAALVPLRRPSGTPLTASPKNSWRLRAIYTSHPLGFCVWTMAGCDDSVTPVGQDVINHRISDSAQEDGDRWRPRHHRQRLQRMTIVRATQLSRLLLRLCPDILLRRQTPRVSRTDETLRTVRSTYAAGGQFCLHTRHMMLHPTTLAAPAVGSRLRQYGEVLRMADYPRHTGGTMSSAQPLAG
jgi:hypothetical protein